MVLTSFQFFFNLHNQKQQHGWDQWKLIAWFFHVHWGSHSIFITVFYFVPVINFHLPQAVSACKFGQHDRNGYIIWQLIMSDSLSPASIAPWEENRNQAIHFHWPYTSISLNLLYLLFLHSVSITFHLNLPHLTDTLCNTFNLPWSPPIQAICATARRLLGLIYDNFYNHCYSQILMLHDVLIWYRGRHTKVGGGEQGRLKPPCFRLGLYTK